MGVSKVSQIDRLFECVSSIEPDLSLPLLVTLLAIERSPGISINELAELIDVPQQTVSRYISILQGRYQPLGTGENFFAKEPLVEIGISSDDPRKRALSVTSRGKSRIESLLRILFKGL